MSKARYRIPSVAAAALLVGGACNDNKSRPGGSTAGINTSDSRIAAIAKALCRQYSECEPDDFEYEHDSVAHCSDYLAELLRDEIPADEEDRDCADAVLDIYACHADVTCRENGDYICRDFEKKADELCERNGDDYDYDYSTASGTAGRLGLRIPR